jgi:MFS family permease
MAERSAPPGRTGAAMTMLAAMTGLGYALGSSVAGQLADVGGHRPAFAVTVAAGVLAAALSLLAGGVLRAEARGTAPATAPATPTSTRGRGARPRARTR